MPMDLSAALAEIRALLLDPDGLVRAVAAGRRRWPPRPWYAPSCARSTSRPVGACRSSPTTGRGRTPATWRTATRPAVEVDALLAEPFGNWHVETDDRDAAAAGDQEG